jgi:hypothetical protein
MSRVGPRFCRRGGSLRVVHPHPNGHAGDQYGQTARRQVPLRFGGQEHRMCDANPCCWRDSLRGPSFWPARSFRLRPAAAAVPVHVTTARSCVSRVSGQAIAVRPVPVPTVEWQHDGDKQSERGMHPCGRLPKTAEVAGSGLFPDMVLTPGGRRGVWSAVALLGGI